MAALVCGGAAASAQTVDGGASAPAAEQPAEPQTVPATEPNAEAVPPGTETSSADGAGSPKALTPQQSLPENLQGWLRERNRRRPAIQARPPLPATPSAPSTDSPVAPESAVEGYKRRLRSFDEHGVTVLSNRHTQPPPLVRVQAAAAVAAVPAPVPAAEEPEPEASSFSETRRLRATRPKQQPVTSEPGPGWPLFAVPVAAISLALIWLRRRRAADGS